MIADVISIRASPDTARPGIQNVGRSAPHSSNRSARRWFRRANSLCAFPLDAFLLPPQASFAMYSLESTFWTLAKFALLTLTAAIAVSGTLCAPDAKSKLKPPITDPTASKASATPSGKDARTQATPDKTMVEAAQQALGEAANKVLNRIQTEESDVHTRLRNFEKDDRLDPSTYKSV